MTDADSEWPAPGLDGTYRGACTVCLRGTDTAVGLEGEAEWVAALMYRLGLPDEQVLLMISDVTDCDRGMVPVGRFALVVKLCGECARKANYKVGPLSGGVPHYSQPYDIQDGRHR